MEQPSSPKLAPLSPQLECPVRPGPTGLRIMAYDAEHDVETVLEDPRQLPELLARWRVTWIDVEGGDPRLMTTLGGVLGLHPLAVEDALHFNQRAKVEQYPTHLFLVARMIRLDGELGTEQLSLFLGRNFVVTFQQGAPGDCFDPVRERIRKSALHLRQAGPDYLAYALLDAVIDAYFPVLEQLGEELEDLEDRILAQPSPPAFHRVHETKRRLLMLRRAVWPLRDALHTLTREPLPLVGDETRLYLRDCYDHTVRIIDFLETYRELGADLMDLYLSSVSQRLNEVMRLLTIIATIFIPLTFISSIYGMNFNPAASPWNMPELNWYWGYPVALLLMGLVALGLLVWFWWRGWLPRPGRKNGGDDEQG